MIFIFNSKDRPAFNPMRETEIESGKIRGIAGGNPICTVFKGIPFAAPPVGKNRFRAPQPVEPWEGVRDCIEFGPAAMQPDRSYEPVTGMDMYLTPYRISEDCLYLNVWTPAETKEDKLPVIFWTHGGGNFGGFGHEPENDGEGFARRGVILVTYNYRLNAFGFLAHPELSAEDPNGVSGNYAVLDAIAALDWTRRNIAAFGGDPDNITIAGQSAGAIMTMCLCTSPLSKGKFAKAIFHSSVLTGKEKKGLVPGEVPTLREAEKLGVRFMESRGCSSIEELRALPAEEILRQRESFDYKYSLGQIVDGYVLKRPYADAMGDGEMPDLPYICSYTSDEFLPEGVVHQVITDGARLFLENQLVLGRKPAYGFRFSRPMPGDDKGAWHTADLFYLFETIDRTWRPMTGYDYELSKRFADYWCNFAKNGDPNGSGLPYWTPFTKDCRKIMDLGTSNCMIDAYPVVEEGYKL
ncbi:MAG: carboxylesterase family protein [Clostridia bacterium]|nr:carboxylesterase family protein [Clostridia bacterium]